MSLTDHFLFSCTCIELVWGVASRRVESKLLLFRSLINLYIYSLLSSSACAHIVCAGASDRILKKLRRFVVIPSRCPLGECIHREHRMLLVALVEYELSSHASSDWFCSVSCYFHMILLSEPSVSQRL